MKTYIFLDTNIYLHYQPYNQINWCDLLNAIEITLVIPPITIRELNEKKDSIGNIRIRKRAGEVIKKLSRIVLNKADQSNSKDAVNLVIEDREPNISFLSYQLDDTVHDDLLLASILMHKSENPNDRVVLVTSDSGLLLLAKNNRLGITTFMLPEKYKIKEEPNPEEEEIKRLKSQLFDLQNQLPQLSIKFSDFSIYHKVQIRKPQAIDKKKIDSQIKQIRIDLPKLEPPGEKILSHKKYLENYNIRSLMGIISSPQIGETYDMEDVIQYNTALENFYKIYADYLRLEKEIEYKNRQLVMSLDLILLNDGGVPAENADITLYFPDDKYIVQREKTLELQKPSIPEKPKMLQEKITGLIRFPVDSAYEGINMVPNRFSAMNVPKPNVSLPKIKKNMSYQVEFSVQKIKHKSTLNLSTIYLIFESYEKATNCNFTYHIVADNYPKKIKGELHIKVDKEC